MQLNTVHVLTLPGTPAQISIDNETIIIAALIIGVVTMGVAHSLDATTLGNLYMAIVGYVFSKIIGVSTSSKVG